MDNKFNFLKGISSFSLCDWGGVVSATLFTGGCDLRCPTCHNWQLATRPREIDTIAHEELQGILYNKRRWIDGLVITGGEPTIHPELPDLIRWIKSYGYKVALHTNGMNSSMLLRLYNELLVDTFCIDVKGPWDKYPSLTGGRCESAQAEKALWLLFRMAEEAPGRFYFRTTKVPALSEEDLATCRSYLPKGHKLHFQEYREPVDPEQQGLLT
jgi:pyruvate formate lyase activating enzyme